MSKPRRGATGEVGMSSARIVAAGADFSPCGKYRYRLWRTLDSGAGRVVFLMLNPSTADGIEDDPTIRKCLGFTQRLGGRQLDVVNLFGYCATNPDELRKVSYPTGPSNDHAIDMVIEQVQRYGGSTVVAAWGAVHKSLAWRVRDVRDRLRERGLGPRLLCLGRTGAGEPRHPLMLAYATTPELFAP